MHARDGLHNGRLAVGHVADGACTERAVGVSSLALCTQSSHAVGAAGGSQGKRVGRQQRRVRQALSLLEGPLHSGGSSSPMLMVAWRLMTSGESAFSFAGSIVARSCFARCELFEAGAAGSSDILAAAIASVAEATAAMLALAVWDSRRSAQKVGGEAFQRTLQG